VSAKTTPKEMELIRERWSVVSKIVDRTPAHAGSTCVKVRVSKLLFDLRHAEPAMVLEGPQSDRTLQDFADKLNAEGRVMVKHQKAFADLPEASRRKTMVKNNMAFTGPGFQAPALPVSKRQSGPKTPRKTIRTANQGADD